MKPKPNTETRNEAADNAGEPTPNPARRSHRNSVTMQDSNSANTPATSRSVIAATATDGNSLGMLRRSRRTSSHHHHATDGAEALVDGKPSTMSGHQHTGQVQVMQQADFSHISALTTMALPSLMASYHASLCQQQLRITPSVTDAVEPNNSKEQQQQRASSKLSVTAAPSTAVSDVSSGGARGRAVSVSVAPEELLADEYERLNKAMTPDMEAKALKGDADDQDYSMYVQSCKLDVAVETAASMRKQLRTVGDYVTLVGCFVMMTMLEPVGLSSGVFVDPLRRAFGVSSSEVGFALSLQLGGLLAVSPLDNWLNVRFGMQTVLMFGAGVGALSFLLTAILATEIWHFYIGYGFFGGLALGMAEYSLVAGSAFIFPGRADLLACICIGVSVGNIAIPPILSKIIEKCDVPLTVYVNQTITNPTVGQSGTELVATSVPSGSGWRGGLYVVAGAQALVMLLALTFRVPEERFFHPPPALVAASGKNFFPPCIFNKQFAVLATFHFFWIMHQQFFSYGPSIVSTAVHDDSITSGYILSAYSAAQLCGRIGTVYLNTKPLSISLRAYTTSGVVALMGFCLIILAAIVSPTGALAVAGIARFVILCIPTAVAGCCSGIIWASCSWIMLEVFGPFQFGSAQNFVNPAGGASNYAGIFAAGKMATDTGVPESPLYMGGAGLLVAAGIMCVLGLIQRRRQIADYAPPAKHVMLESAASADELMLYGSRRSHATKKNNTLVEEVDDEIEENRLSARPTNQSANSTVPRDEFLQISQNLSSSPADRLDSVLDGDHHRRSSSRAWRCNVAAPRAEFVRSSEDNAFKRLTTNLFGKRQPNLAYAALDPEPAVRLLVENNRHAWDANSTPTGSTSSRASNLDGLKLSWMQSNTGGAYGLYNQNSSNSMFGYGRGRRYFGASSSTDLISRGSSIQNWNFGDDQNFG